jgi:hypothetical protein
MRHVFGFGNLTVAVDVTRTVAEDLGHRDAHDQLRFGIVGQQRIVVVDASDALHANTMRPFEIDKQQADLVVADKIAHRIEHAVAIVGGERQRLAIEHAHKTRFAAFVGHRRPALVIDGGEPEHVAALDERLVLRRDLGVEHAVLDVVGQPPHVETILQRAMIWTVKPAHAPPSLGAGLVIVPRYKFLRHTLILHRRL